MAIMLILAGMSRSIHIRELHKAYNRQLVLSIPAHRVPEGLYLLRGPNGVGKSTFMRILSGIVPTKGEITLGGVSLKKQPIAYRRLIAYGEAEPGYPQYVRGDELLAYVCNARNYPLPEAEKLCRLLGVDRFYRQSTESYSSGMRKKLSLVLSLANDCPWILLDEPYNALDAEARELLSTYIRKRHQEEGTSFLLSAHQQLIFPEAKELRIVDTKLLSLQETYAQLPD
jgi:ABC-2 type transport system ATP-binding protein